MVSFREKATAYEKIKYFVCLRFLFFLKTWIISLVQTRLELKFKDSREIRLEWSFCLFLFLKDSDNNFDIIIF